MGISKGELLKQLRKNYNYTLDEVGEKIGVSKQTLYKYENSIITNIPSDKIEALAKIYNTSPAYIMGWEEEEPQGYYYDDPKVNEMAERIRTSGNTRLLFDATKDMTEDDIDFVVKLIEKLKKND